MADYLDAGARISKCGRYRYLLWREWRGSNGEHWRWLGANDGNGQPLGEPKACLFIMLNPSTADAQNDDPTIRRCVGFAKAWGYDRLEVVNLFAHRATSPDELLSLSAGDDPVGPENQDYVEDAAERAGLIVCAWGGNGGHLGQDETVLGWLDRPAHCLGTTRDGRPRHPLYLPAELKLVPYNGRLPVSENCD